MRRKIAIMLVIVGAMTTSAFGQITEKDILGRWYTEEKTVTNSDSDGDFQVLKICMSSEYFRNRVNNFQGEIIMDFVFRSAPLRLGGATLSFRGAEEWQLTDKSLITKIIDVKFRIKDIFFKNDGADVDDDELERFKGDFLEEMKHILYAGKTSDDIIIAADKNRIIIETSEDDGTKKLSQLFRTNKLLDGCK